MSRFSAVHSWILTCTIAASGSGVCATADGLHARQQGKLFYENRKYEQAVAFLRQALQDDASDRETGQLLALSYYSLGQYKDAIPILSKLASEFGATAVDTSYLLGMCYLKSDQAGDARAAFARMYSVPENSAAAHLVFARMLVREHLEERALPELVAAVSGDPRLPMAHFLLGEIYLYKGAADRAVDEFNSELRINPAVWLVQWRLGDALARLERYAEAERALKQSIWLNESFSGPYVTLGQIAFRKGDFTSAMVLLERAVKMDPNNQHAHYLLAKTYQKAGRPDDANRQFDISRSLLSEKNNASLNPQ